MKPNLLRLLFLTLACLAGMSAYAQAWPSKPVSLIVPFDAGSTPDIVSRMIAERLAKQWHQSVIVENKSGAAGNIGTHAVAKAAPDGGTIGVSIAGPLGVNALLFQKMPYDVDKEIALVTIAVSQPAVLVAGPRMAVADAGQWKTAMAKRTDLSFASIGAGSTSHLAMAALVSQQGVDAVHVPYRGSAAAVTALLSGDVDMALLPAAAVMPQVKAGKLKALAVASPDRSPSLPDIPTLAEIGLPDIKGDAWIGFIVPAKTPQAIIDTLHTQIAKALAEPAVKAMLRKQYMDPVGNSPEAFREQLQSDLARWKPVIEQNRIKLN